MITRSELSVLAGLGPFFAVDGHGSAGPPPGPWLAVSELASPAALQVRTELIRAALADRAGVPVESVEQRVAVSVAQLGLCARLLSPMLGYLVLFGRILPLDAQDSYWQPAIGRPLPLSMPAIEAGVGDTAEVTDTRHADDAADTAAATGLLKTTLSVGIIADIVASCAQWSVSAQVLWGNVASALNGAATMIATARPELAGRSRWLTDELLASSPMAGLHRRTERDVFRRRNCCLLYRVGDLRSPQLCGDCVRLA